jgi:MraZ protein
VFRGTFEHLIDQKGRISIPAKFREYVVALGKPELIVTHSPASSVPRLDAYPISAWEALEEKVAGLGRFDPAVTLFEDFYVSNAQKCDIDSQGRILIPPSLRDWAGLAKDVVFTGARHLFRIQDRKAWKQIQSEASARILADPSILGRLGL